ncbi:hypothetical protein [Gorillibacterium massiliense]|uniref:hypothetical protein n=1 Tax=Gorillibacterium massiliense TaxID=1280390 RepID=UPI0005947EEE|nr:hypothetical protein [Gorillibacterium massiliense]
MSHLIKVEGALKAEGYRLVISKFTIVKEVDSVLHLEMRLGEGGCSFERVEKSKLNTLIDDTFSLSQGGWFWFKIWLDSEEESSIENAKKRIINSLTESSSRYVSDALKAADELEKLKLNPKFHVQ